jgi:hypothetical protein
LQAALIPTGVPAWAKKIGAHVVIDAMHMPAIAAEIIDYFRANKTGRACNEQLLHSDNINDSTIMFHMRPSF